MSSKVIVLLGLLVIGLFFASCSHTTQSGTPQTTPQSHTSTNANTQQTNSASSTSNVQSSSNVSNVTEAVVNNTVVNPNSTVELGNLI